MGANGSRQSGSAQGSQVASLQDFLQGTSKALHILSLEHSLPASMAGLEPFFDFITHVNGERITRLAEWTEVLQEDYDITDLDQTHSSSSLDQQQLFSPKPLHLIVYSSKTTSLRNVTVFPILKASKSKAGRSRMMIGANVRECDFESVHERVWHVLEVVTGSPAALSGLEADSDYIIGSRDGGDGGNALIDKNDFGTLVALYEHKQLHLWVYSITLDTVREVVIVPDSDWGGEGLLGCDIGFGNVHRISLGLQRKQQDQRQAQSLEKEPQDQAHHYSSSPSSSSPPVVFEKHPSFPTGLSGSKSGTHSHSHGAHNSHNHENSLQHHRDGPVGHAHADGSIHFGSHHHEPSQHEHSSSHPPQKSNNNNGDDDDESKREKHVDRGKEKSEIHSRQLYQKAHDHNGGNNHTHSHDHHGTLRMDGNGTMMQRGSEDTLATVISPPNNIERVSSV